MHAPSSVRSWGGVAALGGLLIVLVTGLFLPGWMVDGREHARPLPPPASGAAATRSEAPAEPLTGADRASLDEFARRYLTAFNTEDVPGIAELACERPSEAQRLALTRSLRLQRQTATVAAAPARTGDTATLRVTLASSASGEPRREAGSVTVRRDGRGWCVPVGLG